ncbi:MAG: alpha/beta fold hydrolase [Anaerolineales bacterium]
MKRILKYALFLLATIGALGIVGFVLWAETPLGPMPEALEALQSGDDVAVTVNGWLVFEPQGKSPKTGFIFYPGGRVDARSYAPPAREIAAGGYLVVIVPMPLNLAVFGAERAAEVIAAYPQIRHWVIGGHSLGGAMAARFAALYPQQVDGVVLWASYPPDGNPLTNSGLPVLSIYGSEDFGREAIESRKSLLPEDTQWLFIPCANHAQMGWYGPQPGDGEACISREEQQEQVVKATLEFLQRIEMQGGE